MDHLKQEGEECLRIGPWDCTITALKFGEARFPWTQKVHVFHYNDNMQPVENDVAVWNGGVELPFEVDERQAR